MVALIRSVAVLSILALSSSASAQIKPKIMIIFDTSGSMLAGGNDGSVLCNNNGQNSKIYRLKRALFETLQGIGADEADFALATFAQMVDPARNPTCSKGHYYNVSSQHNETGGCKTGCKVSSHASSNSRGDCGASDTPCNWYDDYKVEVLKVPFGSPPEDVMIYFDQLEDDRCSGLVCPSGNCSNGRCTCNTSADCPLTQTCSGSRCRCANDNDCPGARTCIDERCVLPELLNPEVRAWSCTPLGKSLFYAHGYFHKEVVLPPGDYRKKCERLAVALFTDGNETCDSSSGPYYAPKWAAALNDGNTIDGTVYDGLNVVTHCVAIALTSSALEAIATNGKGTYYSVASDTAELKRAFLDIINKSQPPSETCNGEDDDCDGQIDEDFPLKGQPCDNGLLGACFETGTYQCTTDGLGVECSAGPKTGTDEICNGIDDNCDGAIDNKPGGCPVCIPQPEVCNGEDDNCNGEVDEGLPTDLPCGTDIGICTAGTNKCDSDLGKWVCEGGSGPADQELCNNLDDDCDGIVDGMLRQCYPFASGCDINTGVCQGICRLGAELCTAGDWGSCQGAVGPEDEVCNGIDDDCDGQTDEEAECPGGSQCIEGKCTRSCAGGEFVCPPGQICENGWCVLDPCDPAECGSKGWICSGGECVDPCSNVTCKKFEKCVKGRCVDTSCYENGCPPGQRCVQGICRTDPCAAVDCAPDQFCFDGSCLSLCDAMSCEEGQTCQVVVENDTVGTRCVDDPCSGISCNFGYECIDGRCVVEPCSGVQCDKGQLCVKGECIEDACEKIHCPLAYVCDPVTGQCLPGATSTDTMLATGSGGLTCAVDGPPTTEAPWLLLALAALLWIRRRS